MQRAGLQMGISGWQDAKAQSLTRASMNVLGKADEDPSWSVYCSYEGTVYQKRHLDFIAVQFTVDQGWNLEPLMSDLYVALSVPTGSEGDGSAGSPEQPRRPSPPPCLGNSLGP